MKRMSKVSAKTVNLRVLVKMENDPLPLRVAGPRQIEKLEK